MQGMQSNSTPQQRPEQRPEQWPEQWPEQRDPIAPYSGPLEAAQRPLDVRKDTPRFPVLPRSDADGRPGWLRRWAGESRRDPDLHPARGERNPAGEPGPSEAAPASLERNGEGAVSSPSAAVAGPSNGHTGHSIEAGFDFETVFHFETDLEAESTDDWLDLSDDAPGIATAAEEATWNAPAEESNSAHLGGPARSWHGREFGPNPGAGPQAPEAMDSTPESPDPKAVRAAIFRLAQQSQGGNISQRQADNPSGAAVTPPEAAFGEVARQVWAGSAAPETALADALHPNREASSLASREAFRDGNQPSNEGQGDRSGGEGAGYRTESDGAEGGRRSDNAVTGEVHPVRLDLAEDTNLRQQEERQDAPPQAANVDARMALAGRNQVQDGRSGAGTEGPDESFPADSRCLDASAARHNAAALPLPATGSQAEAARPGAEVTTNGASPNGRASATDSRLGAQRGAVLEHGDVPGRAGRGPELAHDAGNLLSALKLYSELLALSGVLHARHKHYAEDLKLLASRSEALIDRLLASCTLAERGAQGFVQGLADRSASSASGVPTGLGKPESNREDQPQAANRAFGHTLLPVDRGTGTEPIDRVNPGFALAAEPVGEPGLEVVSPAVAASPQPEVSGVPASPPLRAQPASARSEDRAAVPPASEAEPADPVNLVDLLTRWGSLLSMIARGPVEVKFGAQAALPVRVGEEAMERILVNLVHNAMKATKAGGAIRIGVGRAETRRSPQTDLRATPGNRMVLTVDDSGCGMSEAQIAEVLGHNQHHDEHRAAPQANSANPSRSHRSGEVSGLAGQPTGWYADPGAPQTQGPARPSAIIDSDSGPGASFGDHRRRGMGLQIVRELVSASGGELAIFSRRGVGTRVEIRWPVEQQEPGLGRIPPASVASAGLRGRWGLGDRRPQPIAGPLEDGAAEAGTTQQSMNATEEGAIAC